MSCLAKLFHSLLNNRLVSYLKKHSVLSEFQIGFMKGYRTTDHIFVLRFLIDNYVKRCKKRYFFPHSLILVKLLTESGETR